jgi:hypothetical protein
MCLQDQVIFLTFTVGKPYRCRTTNPDPEFGYFWTTVFARINRTNP